MKKLSDWHVNKDMLMLAGLIALSVTMRFFSFFPSMISHDESTYFVIARELFQGKTYFTDLVDTKPIGIFLILGLFIRYISSSVFMIRLFTAVIVGLTSYSLYKISLYDQGEEKPAIAAGIIYIFFLSVFTHFGVFVNPELFYNLFTALSFYIFLRARKPGAFLILGLLLGIGFMLKYVVLFDLAAWLLYYFVFTLLQKEKSKLYKAFINCLTACVGFIVPFTVTVIYYYRIGHFQDFWFYTFGVTSRVPVERTLLKTIIYIGDFHLRFLPILFFFYYALIKAKQQAAGYAISTMLVITWCLMVMIAVLLPGKPFGHYFIQMMLPVSIVAGRFFSNKVRKSYWMERTISHPIGTTILSILIVTNIIIQKHDHFDEPDIPKQVAEYLKPKLTPEDRIYTGNYQQILYYLLEKDCPVKYVHRTLMCDLEHRSALQIDLPHEAEALIATNFKYILMKGPYCYEPMNEHIREHYRLIKEFPDGAMVYERK